MDAVLVTESVKKIYIGFNMIMYWWLLKPWMLYWLLIPFIVYRCFKYIVTIVRTDAIDILLLW